MPSITDLVGENAVLHKNGILPGEVSYDIHIIRQAYLVEDDNKRGKGSIIKPAKWEIVLISLGNTSLKYAPLEMGAELQKDHDSYLGELLARHSVYGNELEDTSSKFDEYSVNQKRLIAAYTEKIKSGHAPDIDKFFLAECFLRMNGEEFQFQWSYFQHYQQFIDDLKLMNKSVKYGGDELRKHISYYNIQDVKSGELIDTMDELADSYHVLIKSIRELKKANRNFERFICDRIGQDSQN